MPKCVFGTAEEGEGDEEEQQNATILENMCGWATKLCYFT